jgi:uncharacterized protein (DUF2141 family)
MRVPQLLTASVTLSLIVVSAAFVHATAAPGISAIVKGLRNNQGRVGCALFNGAEGFPREKTKAFRHMWTSKHDNVAVCTFTDVPAGTYAVTVLDDSNSDGKMDFNLIGLPTKGYGFSNDAKATFSPPAFSAASFNYSGQGSLSVPINIVYRTH